MYRIQSFAEFYSSARLSQGTPSSSRDVTILHKDGVLWKQVQKPHLNNSPDIVLSHRWEFIWSRGPFAERMQPLQLAGDFESPGEKDNAKVASLQEENRCLRGSVQNLKEQNERIRAVVGVWATSSASSHLKRSKEVKVSWISARIW